MFCNLECGATYRNSPAQLRAYLLNQIRIRRAWLKLNRHGKKIELLILKRFDLMASYAIQAEKEGRFANTPFTMD